MGDSVQLIQSVFIGILFSFIVAKLISIAISFRDDNTTRVSNHTSSTEPKPPIADVETKKEEEKVSINNNNNNDDDDDSDDDDDDWEGVEYTELDEIFNAATTFVAASAADRLSQRVSSENQLQLYGFYKIATQGPCTTPQPSALNISARAKWNAWQRLGSMSPEEAMQMYIKLVCDLYPSWTAGSAVSRKDGDGHATSSASKGMMGPVFSSLVYEEDSNTQVKLEALHESAREGEIDKLNKYLDTGVSVNLKDSEGRTALHWAVDRGHINIVELLLSKNADVNAKDDEGQTPLHYAAMCDREDVAEFLVKQNADRDVKDNDGKSPCDLCESNSSWMQL